VRAVAEARADTVRTRARTVAEARADSVRTRARIVAATRRLLEQSPSTPVGDIAVAAGVSRSTLYRHFPDRKALVAAAREHRPTTSGESSEHPFPPGRLGRERPVSLEGIHVFDVVAPPVLPEQLVAEAQRIADVPLALYVLDIDGSHLLRVAGPERLPERIEAPLAIGPELDSAGLAELRAGLADRPGIQVVPLWLRGRATGVMLTLGRPRRPLEEIARQAAAAITLADRYTDTFARGQRRKPPRAAAEIQQSLLPPRISRITGGEVAGNVLPSYEVAGDWFDIVENLDGIWITLADGLGPNTRAAASSAVALGALRASRRSGGTTHDALMLMHRTLREMPGPAAEMTAVAARWDPATYALDIVNCGHTVPLVLRGGGDVERLDVPPGRGLGGRVSPRPSVLRTSLQPGDRLVLCSDGVITDGKGRAGLGYDGVAEAALQSDLGSAADTVRQVHRAVLDACDEQLQDDATVVCLAAE
jgi:serine phosphatase RsbU (regulator of sigma subunit)